MTSSTSYPLSTLCGRLNTNPCLTKTTLLWKTRHICLLKMKTTAFLSFPRPSLSSMVTLFPPPRERHSHSHWSPVSTTGSACPRHPQCTRHSEKVISVQFYLSLHYLQVRRKDPLYWGLVSKWWKLESPSANSSSLIVILLKSTMLRLWDSWSHLAWDISQT